MRASDEGLKSEPLRAALMLAVTGKGQKLEDLLCRYGGGADVRPNLKLAAAFGVELAALPDPPLALVSRFASGDAAPDDPRVFLPIAAAHAWVALLRAATVMGTLGGFPSQLRPTQPAEEPAGKEAGQSARVQNHAWASLAELAADERSPVRVGTLDALKSLAGRPGGGLTLTVHAADWLLVEDLEKRFSAAALVLEALHDRRIVTVIANDPASGTRLLEYLAAAINEVVSAPRSAERLDGRRRLLMSLPPILATVVATLSAGNTGPAWFEELCSSADHPDVRKTLSDTILRLRKTSLGHSSSTAQRLRQVLEGSAKPLRDPTRLRPGTGRGKASRPMR